MSKVWIEDSESWKWDRRYVGGVACHEGLGSGGRKELHYVKAAIGGQAAWASSVRRVGVK
jgi:hypothetical protein